MKSCLICGGNKFKTIDDLFDDRYGAAGIHKVYVCCYCGFGKTFPGIKDNEIAGFYAKYYPLKRITSKDVLNSIDTRSWFYKWLSGTDNIAHQYAPNKGKILDIGSASGVSLLEINQLGSDAYGVEPDENAQKIAHKLNLKVFKGLITDNPFPDVKFNCVSGSQVVEHTTDPVNFLNTINKRLSKDGILILSFPNFNSIYRYLFGKKWINWHIPYHLNHFSKRSIQILADKTRYRLIKIRTITPNLWTGLQMAAIFSNSIHKKPGLLWAEEKNLSSVEKKQKYFLNLIATFVSFISTPFNRIIDFLGLGDSIIVFLIKE